MKLDKNKEEKTWCKKIIFIKNFDNYTLIYKKKYPGRKKKIYNRKKTSDYKKKKGSTYIGEKK